ncbi:MAG: BamA/TamA family outer membrane protein, partial [Holosporales bacterium]|nr:BamA/TamA family outer membrane protein [Holosporales bacterium]
GEGDVPRSFVAKHISLEKETILKQSNVSDSKIDLINSGLFAEVNISAEKIGEQDFSVSRNYGGTCPKATLPKKYDQALVKVELIPSPPHTIGGGIYFAATEGVVVSATWQNKNFMKKALDAGAIFQGGIKELSATTFINKPDTFCRHQVLHADASIKHLNTIAYEGEKYSLTAGFIRHKKHTKSMITYSVLPTVEYGTLKQINNTVNQSLFGVTMNTTVNMANHSTSPTSGMVFDLTCHPYFGSLRSDAKPTAIKANAMCVFSSSVKGYLPLGEAIDTESGNVTVIASLLSWGKIAIKDFTCIPFDKRFYGGGRNSVRAYGYQLSGELNSEDKPVGGSSLLEFCVEPRVRISKDFGAVAFFETSCVSKGELMRDHVLCGAGFGVRYFTKFGPVRFDIALPFKRRESNKHDGKYVDRSIQFYISVGQSF